MQDFLIFCFFVLGLAGYFYLRSPSFKGAVGESRVSSQLQSTLDPHEYQILGNLTLPTKDGTTQIDHVVVSRYGVFVIETKNMKGWIFGGERQARWTQTLRRHKSQFQNPLRQNYKHIKVIQELLGLKTHQIHNVVAFVGSAEPKTAMPQNVLWSERQLSDYIKSKRVAIFAVNEVRSFADRLNENSLESSREIRRDHVRRVKAHAIARKMNTTHCPRCNSEMVERANKKSGQKFLGCSGYPKCKGTRKIP